MNAQNGKTHTILAQIAPHASPQHLGQASRAASIAVAENVVAAMRRACLGYEVAHYGRKEEASAVEVDAAKQRRSIGQSNRTDEPPAAGDGSVGCHRRTENLAPLKLASMR